MSGEKIRCDAYLVMCYIAPVKVGACDCHANDAGLIIRCDPLTIPDRRLEHGGEVRHFLISDWDGTLSGDDIFVSGVGADYVTVVTEAIFSYSGVKVKIDTDCHLGHEGAVMRRADEAICHVTKSEYGSQMLSLGGIDHMTGGSKSEGRVTCDARCACAIARRSS